MQNLAKFMLPAGLDCTGYKHHHILKEQKFFMALISQKHRLSSQHVEIQNTHRIDIAIWDISYLSIYDFFASIWT